MSGKVPEFSRPSSSRPRSSLPCLIVHEDEDDDDEDETIPVPDSLNDSQLSLLTDKNFDYSV